MPKLTSRVPSYRKHKASGQAVVTISGKDYYLGPHGTTASKRAYDRLICEYLQRDRRGPASVEQTTMAVLIDGYREDVLRQRRHSDARIRQCGVGTSLPCILRRHPGR